MDSKCSAFPLSGHDRTCHSETMAGGWFTDVELI